MKRLSLQFSALLAALFLFAFSCQDHYVPEEPEPETPSEAPVVQTLALTVENQNTNVYRYKLNLEKIGNIPITGFGVVFSTEFNSNAPFTKVPTIADNKVVFPMPFNLGEKSKVDAAPPIGFKTIYYRAYVTYGVNSVAYGDVMEFSPVAPVLATIKSIDPAGSKPTTINMEILTAGNMPIEEYGIVYSSRNDRETESINSTPTILDSKLLSSEPKAVGYHLVVADFKSSNFADVYFRAYLKHTNGAIVYGDIKYYLK